MIRCAQTISGVLMIVGLGFLAGSVQALLRDKPLILGVVATVPAAERAASPASDPASGRATDPATTPAITPASGAQNRPDTDPTPPATIPGADSAAPVMGEGDSGEAEYEARLDAPVPAGMLTLRRAHQMWIDGAYFVDARRLDEYEAGHVSGAAHLTAENIVTRAGQDQLATIPPDAAVVIYCIGGEGCDASKNTMALMQQYGYTDMHIMGVGYDEWAAAGLPTDKGAP